MFLETLKKIRFFKNLGIMAAARVTCYDIENSCACPSSEKTVKRLETFPVPKKAMTGIINTNAGIVCIKSIIGLIKA